MPNFTYEIDSLEISNTRSQHKDTDYLVLAAQVGTRDMQYRHAPLGDLNNGTKQLGISLANVPVNPADGSIWINYLIVNAGGASVTDVENALQATAGELIHGAIPNLPVLTSLVIPFFSFFKQSLSGILKSPCDGLVAAEQNTYSYPHLTTLGSQPPYITQKTVHSGEASPTGCNTRPSYYVVTWTVKEVVVVPSVTNMDFPQAQGVLRAVGLQAQQKQEYPNKPGAWVVIQSPPANSIADAGQFVVLTTIVAP